MDIKELTRERSQFSEMLDKITGPIAAAVFGGLVGYVLGLSSGITYESKEIHDLDGNGVPERMYKSRWSDQIMFGVVDNGEVKHVHPEIMEQINPHSGIDYVVLAREYKRMQE